MRLWAVVSPLYEPVAPGAFDFARKAFFERLGAMGAPRLLDPPVSASGESAGMGLALGLAALRHKV